MGNQRKETSGERTPKNFIINGFIKIFSQNASRPQAWSNMWEQDLNLLFHFQTSVPVRSVVFFGLFAFLQSRKRKNSILTILKTLQTL